MSKRYIVSNHKVMQDERVVWSMSEEDLFKSWTETFADLLNAETAPLLARIAELENVLDDVKDSIGYRMSYSESNDLHNTICNIIESKSTG